tara:strand:+ start:137 stop:796 length:660 start_codon:yes stop_codon:yes gene_type:complete
MINNIIFDFDGVLVDSEMLVAKSFSKYINNLGYNFKEQDFAQFAGLKTFEVISILSKKFLIKDKKKFHDDIMNIVTSVYLKKLEPVKGVYDFVNNCTLNLFIGSNSFKDRILDGLKIVKLDKYFGPDQVYSFDMVNKPKPFPDIYLKVINDNNLNKNETIIIEDSSVGVKAGVSAQVKVIGLTAGGHWYKERSSNELFDAGAIEVINDFNKIMSIIDKY